MQVIILAGGNGTRMGGDTQKCLLPVSGVPILGHILRNVVAACGVVEFLIGVSYKAADVVAYVRSVLPKGCGVTFVPHPEGRGWEGWDIYGDMAPLITGPFLATAGDVLVHPACYEQTRALFHGAVDAAITMAVDTTPVDTHGIGTIHQGRVTQLVWQSPQPFPQPGQLRDMTIWMSDTRFFDFLRRYPHPKKSIGYVFASLVANRHVIAGHRYEGEWIHLGYPHDLGKTWNTMAPSRL